MRHGTGCYTLILTVPEKPSVKDLVLGVVLLEGGGKFQRRGFKWVLLKAIMRLYYSSLFSFLSSPSPSPSLYLSLSCFLTTASSHNVFPHHRSKSKTCLLISWLLLSICDSNRKQPNAESKAWQHVFIFYFRALFFKCRPHSSGRIYLS